MALLSKIRDQNVFDFILNIFGGIFALYAEQTKYVYKKKWATVGGGLDVK